jgi:hypothetical protein
MKGDRLPVAEMTLRDGQIVCDPNSMSARDWESAKAK